MRELEPCPKCIYIYHKSNRLHPDTATTLADSCIWIGFTLQNMSFFVPCMLKNLKYWLVDWLIDCQPLLWSIFLTDYTVCKKKKIKCYHLFNHQSCYLSKGITMSTHILKCINLRWLSVIYKHLHQHILCLTECLKLYKKKKTIKKPHVLLDDPYTHSNIFYAVKQWEEIWARSLQEL